MKKLLIILAILGILEMTAMGWSAPFLICDCQDNVDQYVLVFDNGTPVTVDAVTAECTNDQKRLSFNVAPLNLSDGQHHLDGKAKNVWGESVSVPFDFNKAVPSIQTGIGLSPIP